MPWGDSASQGLSAFGGIHPSLGVPQSGLFKQEDVSWLGWGLSVDVDVDAAPRGSTEATQSRHNERSQHRGYLGC